VSTKDAVTLSVPASMEVTFTPGQDGSMQVTLTPRTPAGRPPEIIPDPLRQVRAARVARRGRAPGDRNQPGGQAWHDGRARLSAVRAFADADPRFSRADYETQNGNVYINSRLRRAFEEAQAQRQAGEDGA